MSSNNFPLDEEHNPCGAHGEAVSLCITWWWVCARTAPNLRVHAREFERVG